MIMYYDKQGQPIVSESDIDACLIWAKLFEDTEYKVLARTELPNGVRISTVWIGIDHSFLTEGLPMIFETMIFGENATQGDEYQERYATEEEALAGHKTITRIEEAAL